MDDRDVLVLLGILVGFFLVVLGFYVGNGVLEMIGGLVLAMAFALAMMVRFLESGIRRHK